MQQKKSGVTFILSVIFPGVGHLYLGLMRQGLQFMLLFMGSIIVNQSLPGLSFPALAAVVWFYAMFDALQKTSLYNRRLQALDPSDPAALPDDLVDRTPRPDGADASFGGPAASDPLADRFWFDSKPATGNLLWLGVVFIVFGLLALVSSILPDAWYAASQWIGQVHLGGVLVALVMIYFGYRIIRTQFTRTSDHEGDDQR